MEMTQKALTIAGSDCSGGAGIQADLKTFSAHGVYGMSVITAIVAENTYRVSGIMDVNPDMIDKQIKDVFEDICPDAVKIGMLNTIETMISVAESLKIWQPQNVVIDPVMYAKNCSPLMALDAIETLIKVIVPLATLVTPNIPEAEEISGMTISNIGDMKVAAIKYMRWVANQCSSKMVMPEEMQQTFFTMVTSFISLRHHGYRQKIHTAQAVRYLQQLPVI